MTLEQGEPRDSGRLCPHKKGTSGHGEGQVMTRTDIGVTCLRATEPKDGQRAPDAEGDAGAGAPPDPAAEGASAPAFSLPACSGVTRREPHEGLCSLLYSQRWARRPAPHRCPRRNRTLSSPSEMQQEAFIRRLLFARDGAEGWGVSQPQHLAPACPDLPMECHLLFLGDHWVPEVW